MTPTTHDGERPVERRLRQALDARAAEVTVRTLRPADPPGPHTGLPRLRRRLTFALAGLGAAAAAAALAGYLVLAPDDAPVRPVPPAAPPELLPPSPSPSPSPSLSSPGSATPSPGATRTPKSPSASPSSSLPAPGASVSRSVRPSDLPSAGGKSASPSVPSSPSPS